MTDQLDECLKLHIKKLCGENNSLQLEDFYTDALISTQKVAQCTEELKKKLLNRPGKMNTAKLLLLSAKMEMIYSCLIDIKRECSL